LSLVSELNTMIFKDIEQQAFKQHVGKMQAYALVPAATERRPQKLTERVLQSYGDKVAGSKAKETPEFVGRAVVAMKQDPALLDKTGKVVMAAELAEEYGYTDIDGNMPYDRVMKALRETMSRPPDRWVKDW
jgi:dehydrogenase/reductase SDR family protein 1